MGTKKLELTTGVRRRRYTDEFKDEAVQMLLDGHSANSNLPAPVS
jgi:transposase-like protein